MSSQCLCGYHRTCYWNCRDQEGPGGVSYLYKKWAEEDRRNRSWVRKFVDWWNRKYD